MNDLFGPVSVNMNDDWPDDAAEQFWQQWFPGHVRKHSKKQVGNKLARIRRDREATWAEVFGALLRYTASEPDPRYIPAPMVWLNQQRWLTNYSGKSPRPLSFGDVMMGRD